MGAVHAVHIVHRVHQVHLPLPAQGPPVEVALQPELDLLDQGLDMSVRGAGGNDEHVGQDNESGYVEQGDGHALLVGDRSGGGFGSDDGFLIGADGSNLPATLWAGYYRHRESVVAVEPMGVDVLPHRLRNEKSDARAGRHSAP